jgi:conjugative transposon TraM protein
MKENNPPTAESKPGLTPAQKQKMKKYAVFALLFIIFGACMWLIFTPSSTKKAKEQPTHGFNPDIPMPKEKGIVGDKKLAYEEEQDRQKKEEKVRSLQDFAAMLGQDGKESPLQAEKSSLTGTGLALNTIKSSNANCSLGTSRSSSIQNSVSAYRNINRTLGSFYDTPRQDSEKERLAKELEETKAKLADRENHKNNVDEQIALMEKSYQMAAKYMPQMQGQGQSASGMNGQSSSRNGSGKMQVVPVSHVVKQTVSSLQPSNGAVSIAKVTDPVQNAGFLTPTSTVIQETKNTIQACIHNTQTVMDGQSVRLRLLEQVQVGSMDVPRNAVITGVAKVQGERLEITVGSLEYAGTILPVSLSAYDTDGQRGIFIPNTTEVNAAKEAIANMGTSTGTSISLAGNAGQQLAADMGRSLIQGASQLVAKKLREVKVKLKAGYRIFLLANDKQNSIQ